MNRRGFFKFIGAAPVALVAPVAVSKETLTEYSVPLVIDQMREPATKIMVSASEVLIDKPLVTGTVISASEMADIMMERCRR